uniref:Tox-SGS domain-containing protein n=1 Tax=Aedes aegypti TaxID=7159 RepID=A0A6I8U0Q3_AEDAE
MYSTVQLNFSDQIFPFGRNVRLYHSNNRTNANKQLYAFHNGKLYDYQYDSISETWQNIRNSSLVTHDESESKILCFPKATENILLVKTTQGLNFYRRKANGSFDLLAESHEFYENEFHDVYGWNRPDNVIRVGHFYHDRSIIGVLTNHQEYGIKFFAVIESELLAGEYPIWPLETDLSMIGNSFGADFYLADLQETGQDNIIVRNLEGLNVYTFNQRNGLQKFMQVPYGAKQDNSMQKVYFPNLTGRSFRDIIVFNSSGLFVYQYHKELNNYNCIHSNAMFSTLNGWSTEHFESVKFEDLDINGRQEMVFTGPSGIDILSFEDSTNEWRSLLNYDLLTIPQRHAEIIAIISDTVRPMLFTQQQNELQWANVEIQDYVEKDHEEQATNETSPQLVIPEIPELIQLPLENEDPIILLRDQLDWSTILDSVDRNTGKPNFRLPLIDLSKYSSNLKLDIFYDGNSKVSDILGVGWSLPQNFIILDHQSSVFPEYEKYYLVTQGFPQKLVYDSANSTDDIDWFKISESTSDVQIRHWKTEEKWEITNKGIKQIFGRTENSQIDSVGRDLVWENWRGKGSSFTGQKQLATSWYLVEVCDQDGNMIHYRYDSVNAAVSTGNGFTQEVYLQSISDNMGNQIFLIYSNKDRTEYKALPLRDKDGNLNINRLQTRYLSGCKVVCSYYQQDIVLAYNVESGKRYLTRVIQEGDTGKPILQFIYEEIASSKLLSSIILPTAATFEFSYQLLGSISPVTESIGRRFDVPTNYRVDYGEDDVLISYLNEQAQVVLRMFNQDLTVELGSSVSSGSLMRFPLLGRGLAKAYEIGRVEIFIAVIMYYSTDKELCLIRREQGKRQSDVKCYDLSEAAIIRFGRDFVLVADIGFAAELIEWNKESGKWDKFTFFGKSQIREIPVFVAAFDRTFVVYDDNYLRMGYRSLDSEWQSKVIAKVPGLMKNIKETLNKFGLDIKLHKQLLNYFTSNALHLDKNLVLLNGWNAVGMQLYSSLSFFTLNKEYQNAQKQQFEINQDDLEQFDHEIDGQEGNFFTIAYKYVESKYKLMVKDFRGPILDEIYEHYNKTLEEYFDDYCGDKNGCGPKMDHVREDVSKEMEKSKDEIREKVLSSLGNAFFLNPGNYTAILNSQTATCGNWKFTFTGDTWTKEQLTRNATDPNTISIPLGDNLILDKQDSHSSLKLYRQGSEGKKQGNSLLDLGVKHLNQTLSRNMFPAYLAYQEKNKQVGVVQFTVDGNMDKVDMLPLVEKLSPWSNYQTLVTSVDHFNTNESCTVVFRQQLGIRRLLPNPVVTKVQVSFGQGNKRVTGFEYDKAKAIGDTVYYERSSLIPGNEKSSFGWVEEVTNSDNQTEVKSLVFDALGKLIPNRKSNERQNNEHDDVIDEDNVYSNTTLYDESEKLEVAQFFPYEMADEEVGYYGFEDYETNRIGARNSINEKSWIFNESDVVKGGFSLTGQNYLSLSTGTLVGTFQPQNQNQEFVASCWLRSSHSNLELGAVVPYLQVSVQTENGDEISGLLSETKYRIKNWFYLEVIINLLNVKQIHEGMEHNSTSVIEPDTKLVVSIIVGPEKNSTIEIDHVRFSPLKSDIQANVYESKRKRIKEVIQANGLIKRLLYSHHQEPIASINAYGQLVELNTHTKSSSVGRIVKLKSSLRVKPESGFLEDFAPYSFQKRWTVDRTDDWRILPGQLLHITDSSDRLRIDPYEMSTVSYGMRLHFSLQSVNSVIEFNSELKVTRNSHEAELVCSGQKMIMPLSGEILIVSEYNRLFVWVDGGLYIDTLSNNVLFELKMAGQVKIKDVVIFSEPRIQVTYFNELGEKLQEVMLETKNTIVVTEYLYDKLGRHTITTQSVRLQRSSNQPLLTYNSNFVTNGNPFAANSVWATGKLQGEITEMVGEYAFSQVKYDNNPLDEKCAEGLPGSEFSVSGPYAKLFSHNSKNSFVNNLYPQSQNFSYQVEHKPGSVEHISVFDSKNNKVAWYVQVPRSKDLLSTYEYNENGKLVRSLPPLYHEKVRTLQKLNFQLNSTSEEEQALQRTLGIHISYDNEGTEIAKTTPDSGKIESLHDNTGLLRYTIYHSNENDQDVESIVYYEYNGFGRLNSTGRLTAFSSIDELLDMQLSRNNTEQFQQFHQSDNEREPIWRGQMKRIVTFNEGEPLVEESALNSEQETLSKKILIPIEGDTPLSIVIDKRYSAGELREIEYPFDIQGIPLRIRYSYNKLGKVTGIGLSGPTKNFVNFTYNSAGQIASEQHLLNPTRNFTRHYSYEGPGFLTKLEDEFLTEKVYYTSGSYGGHGYGDGTITRTEFKATWHGRCDGRKLGLNERSFMSNHVSAEESALCFRELKEAGYLDDHNRQSRAFYPALETNFPIVCSYGITGRQIQAVLGGKGFPSKYGHSYDYGNHQELTNAKYFVGNDAFLPLQPDTFSREIPEINSTVSENIWKSLKNAGYLIEDNVGENVSLAHSKRGKSYMRPALLADLRSINTCYGTYKPQLEQLIAAAFSERQSLSLLKSNLQAAFAKWNITTDHQQAAARIMEMLETKQYLEDPLSEDFTQQLKKYEKFIPDIVGVLIEYFAHQLGEAEFDVESYDIDANGNHKHFYTGFDRYELSYRNNTNQVDSVNFKSFVSSQPQQKFKVEHDSRGNVIQALHRGIQQISYNPVSNRATKMLLTDGRSLTFYYDAQGERLLKRVTNSQGVVTKEILYIRDEVGRTLVERQTTYVSKDLAPDVLTTAYIYGPRGLVGFLRRDDFYSVITDHEGSIRLVVKGDEVVAAYDYLPYGNLMRVYGNNPEGHISYRYTGQEWDEETGLYNYHARFYDPSIGRFYQIDPKGQYFSPYKYAGNSPISMVDPDGQFAWFLIPLIVGLAIGGAYLGGSAANRNWNPAKWKWKSGKTWLGLIGGGIGGALLPLGFGASVSAFTAAGLSTTAAIAATSALGVAGSYISIAAVNNQWNPAHWDFTSPETWSAVLQGFAIGSGAMGGYQMTRQFYSQLSQTGKKLFLAGSLGYGSGTFVMNGFASGWDFSKPGIFSGLFDALTAAPDMPMFLRGIGSQMRTFNKFSLETIKHLVKNRKSLAAALRTVRDMDEFWKVAQFIGAIPVVSLSIYAIGSAVNDNGKSWDMTSVGSYQAMINGLLTGRQLSSFGKASLNKYRAYKNVKMGDRAVKISNEVGHDAVEIYKSLLRSDQIISDPRYSQAVTLKLSVGRIPNVAMTVAITNRWMVVSFSTNNGPGLVLLYSHTKLSSPVLKGRSIQHNNGLVANKPISLNDNDARNTELLNAINKNKDGIKNENVKKFNQDQELMKIFNQEGIDIEAQHQLNKSIKTKLETDGYVSKNFAKEIFIRQLETKGSVHPEVKLVSDELTNRIAEKNAKILELKDNPQSQEIRAEIDNIKSKVSKLQKKLKTTKNAVVEKLTQLSWEYLKQFEKGFPTWEPTNCAEPHTVTALSRIDGIFPDSKLKLKYASKDIKYMSTYKLTDLPNLIPFPRCSNCLITTANVKNVITDPYWFEKINDFKINAYFQFDFAKERLYFLLPHLHMFDRQAQHSNTTITTVSSPNAGKESRRRRRETKRYLNNRIASVTSSANQTPSWISGLTDWLRSSIRGLYSSPALTGNRDPQTSQINTPIDEIGTLMLLDVMIRKVSGQNYSPTIDGSTMAPLEAQSYALNITEAFGKAVEQAALRSHLSIQHLNIDYTEMQGKILTKVLSGKLDDILDILKSYVMNALYSDGKERLNEENQIKFEQFIGEFNTLLNVTFNQLFL